MNVKKLNRTYVLLLFVNALLWLGGASILHFQALERLDKEMQEETVAALRVSANQLEHYVYQTSAEMEYSLGDFQYLEFQPLLPPIELIRDQVWKRQRVNSRQKHKRSPKARILQLNEDLEKVRQAATPLFLSQSKVLRLSEETAAERLLELNQLTEPLKVSQRFASADADNDVAYVTFLNRQIKILRLISGLFHRHDDFVEYFPVVSLTKSSYAPGDTLNAVIYVGSFLSRLNPENVEFRVNGQTIPMGENGTATYSPKAGIPGVYTLETTVKVTNPITGEVTRGDGQYTYEVIQ